MTTEVSASARPLRADAERNRLRILQAAAEVFARRGLEAGLDEIARHAGVGTGTVYRRFPDKSLLVEALIDQRLAALEELAERALRFDSAWDGIVLFLENVVERLIADRGLTDMVFTTCGGNQVVVDRRSRLEAILAELVERAKEQGEIRADLSVTDLAMLQFMLVAGGSFGADVRPDVWRRHLVLVLDGLRTRRDAPTPLPAEPLSVDELQAACAKSVPARAPGRPGVPRSSPAPS
jgi:AcrR family transcriptional regulator